MQVAGVSMPGSLSRDFLMPSWLQRLRLRAEDEARHSRALRELASSALCWSSKSPDKLTRAYELSENFSHHRAISARLQAMGAFEDAGYWLEKVRHSPRYQSSFKQKMTLGRSVVLKAPGPGGEKGLLLMTFEYNWARLMLGLDASGRRWIDEHFNLVLSTSWSPTDYAVLALMLACTRDQLFVQACNHAERDAIEAFHPRLTSLRTMPCDWLDPEGFLPKPAAERTIDLLMVANWGKFKRHWEFFEVLTQLPSGLNVVFIGQKCDGRSKEDMMRMAQDYGVKQNIVFYESLPISEVARLQSDAKVSVIMTRREGCCVAAVESMMAGAALAMRADAHVGPLAHINEQTGARLRPGHLAEDLTRLLKDVSTMNPRDWCLNHACNTRSRLLLEEQLSAHELSSGRPWTRGIMLPKWRPHPTFALAEEQQALKPVYEELSSRFPAVFSPSLWDQSWQ